MTTNDIIAKYSFIYYENQDDKYRDMLIEFAKIHVIKALEKASLKIKLDALETYGTEVPDCWSVDSILNAYDIDNIK